MRPDPDFRPLETERLVLRRSRLEDAEAISAYRSLPDVGRYQGWDRTDPEFLRREIEQMSKRAPGDPGWVQLTALEREGGRLVGDVGISPADGEPTVLKVGYTIDPSVQGRGYATEAVRALVRYAFEVLGAEVVRIYADTDNVASIRVAEKAGLHHIETFEHREGDDRWSVVRYELGREEAERSEPLAGETGAAG